MPKKNTFKIFINEIPQNLFSGFVVSLIALPLGLGLALASGAPPISGVIAAIVGGIVVSIIGGSNVTITGPGNGLVVVLLGAITTLGEGDMQQGFLYTLAAVVISGTIMILLGFLRMGSLGDFFPASAIQGMLAAIGIGIFAKQIHVMFGNLHAKGSIIELLIQIPEGILNLLKTDNSSMFSAGLVGFISLLIMIFYGKIRNRYLKLIPAPMWIVVLSVGMYYYFDLISASEEKKRPQKVTRKTSSAPKSQAESIIDYAEDFIGVRYKWGGTTKSGMDCSGLIYESFRAHDINLPRISRDMAKRGQKITLKNVHKGDLLFFKTGNRRNSINHVGLIVSIKNKNIEFIHATSSKGVTTSWINESYWSKAFYQARRII